MFKDLYSYMGLPPLTIFAFCVAGKCGEALEIYHNNCIYTGCILFLILFTLIMCTGLKFYHKWRLKD